MILTQSVIKEIKRELMKIQLNSKEYYQRDGGAQRTIAAHDAHEALSRLEELL